MIDDKLVAQHKARGLNPEHPTVRGTAANPDVYFQSREAVNKFYNAVPQIVKEEMAKFEKIAGRHYDLFQYVGDKDAERLVVIMGSGADVAQNAVEAMKGEKVGVLKIKLFRPFSIEDFIKVIRAPLRK